MELKLGPLHSAFSNIGSLLGGEAMTGCTGSTKMGEGGGGGGGGVVELEGVREEKRGGE